MPKDFQYPLRKIGIVQLFNLTFSHQQSQEHVYWTRKVEILVRRFTYLQTNYWMNKFEMMFQEFSTQRTFIYKHFLFQKLMKNHLLSTAEK